MDASDLPDGVLDGCVVSACGALRFPASSAGVVEVRYPIVFGQ
jgi:hypothetical protein